MSKQRSQIMADLGELMKRQQELMDELPRAIRTAQIWDDAFLDGQTCSPILIGTNYPRGAIRYGKGAYPEPYQNVREITRTFLRRKDGVEFDISEEDFFSIINAGP